MTRRLPGTGGGVQIAPVSAHWCPLAHRTPHFNSPPRTVYPLLPRAAAVPKPQSRHLHSAWGEARRGFRRHYKRAGL
ncbi:hypothetical protein NDU88_000248 [Pleurodeles waltl]|uniref:Uncharacterized protein n=1 Tax=Pleurodeles waltl TaxID=8319 RepID=A0AAV7L7Z9_PLEWA|nr:hypothetical protein NDU88_000248 [Pleurodeles waltl]